MWGDRIAKDVEPLEIQEWIDSLSKGLRAKVRNLMSAVYKLSLIHIWLAA